VQVAENIHFDYISADILVMTIRYVIGKFGAGGHFVFLKCEDVPGLLFRPR